MMCLYPFTCPTTSLLAGNVKGQMWHGFPHFFQPGAFLWVPLLTGGSLEEHNILLIFLGCLSAGMGGAGKISFKFSFFLSIPLKCFLITSLGLDMCGLKSMGTIILSSCFSSFGPSGAVQTVSDSRRPLFLVINLLLVLLGVTLLKTL